MQKEITYWSPYSLWQRCVLTYEPLRKGGIEPSEHPAVQEDEWLAKTPEKKEKKYRKRGELVALVRAYLARHGPSSTRQITDGLNEDNVEQVFFALTRHPEFFCIVSYEYVPSGRGSTRLNIWGLQDQGGAS